MLGEIIKQVTNEDLRIVCEVGEVEPPIVATGPPPLPPADEISHTVAAAPAPAPAAPQNETVAAISNIFGGAEVLES
jgi:hypothetical protein